MSEMSVDNSLGAYDASTGIFITPVTGKYEIMSAMVTSYDSSVENSTHEYVVQLKVDGTVVDKINHYGDDRSVGQHIISEINLTKGQKVELFVYTATPTTFFQTGCIINGNSVGCSYIQGKLLKRS